MPPKEVWKLVPSIPDLEASSWGRIRIMPHGFYRGKPTYGVWSKIDERFIVRLRRYGTKKIARLVCEAFHGPMPAGKPYCIHEDENPRNNKPTNLKWGSQKENLNGEKFLAYCRSRTGANNPYLKGRKAAA